MLHQRTYWTPSIGNRDPTEKTETHRYNEPLDHILSWTPLTQPNTKVPFLSSFVSFPQSRFGVKVFFCILDSSQSKDATSCLFPQTDNVVGRGLIPFFTPDVIGKLSFLKMEDI